MYNENEIRQIMNKIGRLSDKGEFSVLLQAIIGRQLHQSYIDEKWEVFYLNRLLWAASLDDSTFSNLVDTLIIRRV